jgi:hypothetical protein
MRSREKAREVSRKWAQKNKQRRLDREAERRRDAKAKDRMALMMFATFGTSGPERRKAEAAMRESNRKALKRELVKPL